jgi:4-hydroxy-tetrahydrodipicolinate synthase
VSPAPVVFSAVPTLFSADGEVDTEANRALYKFVGGLLDGVLVAGTTGEFPALSDAERLALIELALGELGPARVIAHVGAPDARRTARLARAAADLGATQLAAITPYYLPVRPDEVIGHFGQVRSAVPEVALYAYLYPERTGVRVSAETFAALASAAGLAGAKLSGSAAGELANYAAAVVGAGAGAAGAGAAGAAGAGAAGAAGAGAPGLRLLSGDDADPAATMRAGGAGLISGRSSAFPEVYAGLAAALGAGDEAAAARYQAVLDRIVALGASIGRLKFALALRGLGVATARMPVDPPDAGLAAAIAALIAEVTALLRAGVLACELSGAPGPDQVLNGSLSSTSCARAMSSGTAKPSCSKPSPTVLPCWYRAWMPSSTTASLK